MKFIFTTDFQYDLLKFTVQDRNGYKALELYEDSYFVLTEHAVIAYTLKRYYKKKKVIPGKTLLLEELNNTFNSRDFINNLTDEDRKEIVSITRSLYTDIVQDGDEILENTERFAKYVSLKEEIENVDLLNYDQYEEFSKRVQKAISPRIKAMEERGLFLVKDIKYRQIDRKTNGLVVPLPWRELNRLTNAGGYSRGSILVILDKAKRFKTGALVVIAKRYMQYYKKNVLVIDLDNGKGEFLVRIEQSISKMAKAEVLEEDNEKKVREILRRSKKHGGEIVVKRMPALTTTALEIGNYIDYLKRENGFVTEILIIDYLSKMGSISGKESLHERIGDAYIDIGNLAIEKDIDLIWTAQHVNKEGIKSRQKTVYEAQDVAGTLDITRHAQAIYGLNHTPEEEENNYQRLEIVDQRDGPPHGRVVFKIDMERQLLEPLRGKELEEYNENINISVKQNDNSYEGNRKKGGDLNDT